jgi:glycosyltransferase involved in cell wall biosynthesis
LKEVVINKEEVQDSLGERQKTSHRPVTQALLEKRRRRSRELEAKPTDQLGKIVEVSVVLPSKNEEETIEICINKIKKVFEDSSIVGEIIVADNSQDETPFIANKLGAKVVTPDRGGYGYAYTYAFKHVKGRYVVIGDADDTYDFLEMPILLEPLRKGEADMVLGSRLKGKIEKGAMPWLHRQIGNPVLTWFLNLFFKAGISDAHSGFRAFTKEALEELEFDSDGMEFASEMVMEAAKKGLKIKEVPISYHKRRNGNSKLSSYSDGWRHLKFMLLHAPNFLFLYPGLFILLTGFFWSVLAFFNINVGFVLGSYSMIAGSLLTIVGYQIVFFAFFANIYEGKRVPRFLTLERGGLIGVLVFSAGFIYVLGLLLKWASGGYGSLPPLSSSILGYTLITLGTQTFFSSFMLSVIATNKAKQVRNEQNG